MSIYPTSEDPEYVSAQGCRDGVFATLVVARPDLVDTVRQTRSISDSLSTVLTRALEG